MVVRNIMRGFLDAIYPPICLICGQFSDGTHPTCCPACLGSFVPVGSSCCELCGEPFSGKQLPHLCLACIKGRPPFEKCRSAFFYDGVLAQALSMVKYGGKTTLLGPLEDALLAQLSRLNPFADADLVVPVPMSWYGRWKRGFNQSFILASAVARNSRAKVLTGSLHRTGNKAQAGLAGKDRVHNAAVSFLPGKDIERVAGMRVLLFDDVYTTGATVRACSRILKKAGAAVWVLTLARTKAR